MMQLQYASDLHLEFNDNENFLYQNPLVPRADVLILAGDITTFKYLPECGWFFDWISANFKQTYWIPGNHEYYHFDLAHKKGAFAEQIRNNVWLVNDFAITIEDTRLIFSTLWTDIKPNHAFAIERGMNDFHLIRFNGNRLSADDLREEHKNSRTFIEQELALAEPGLTKVVVTHHVPTFINYPEQYRLDILSEAFAVELKNVIREYKPDYWIYGHHHQNIPEFSIGETKLVTNQLGYVRNDEHRLFNRSKVLGASQVSPDEDFLPGLRTDDDNETQRRWRRGPKR
jgi:predicted phosphohydrolase